MILTLFVEAPRQFRARKGTGKLTSAPHWMNANHRLSPHPKADLTRRWREAGLIAARRARLPRNVFGRVFIEAWIHTETARSYDAMNLYPTAKALVDGIVTDHGLLPDDSNKHVVGPFCLPGKKRQLGGVTLRIISLEPGQLYPTHHEPFDGRAEDLT